MGRKQSFLDRVAASPGECGAAGSLKWPCQPCDVLLNRETATLEFNWRVLAQARRADVPLLERLRYICIVSSNMDEFFEVRMATTSRPLAIRDRGRQRRPGVCLEPGSRADRRPVQVLQRRGDAGACSAPAFVVISHAERDKAQRRWSRSLPAQVRPLLVPVGWTRHIRFHRWPTSRSTSSCAWGKDAFGARTRSPSSRCRVCFPV